MSEGVIISLISSAATSVNLVLAYLIKRDQNRATKKRDEVLTTVTDIQETQKKIEKNVNGKMDKLIEDSKAVSHLQGKLEGKQELRRELDTIHITVIDDDMDALYFVENDVLIPMKYKNYSLYYDEDKAIGELKEEAGLYILDHLLVKRDGLDMMEIIKTKNIDNVIILYSGTKNRKVVGDYLNEGANWYIDKDDADRIPLLKKCILLGMKEIALKK